MTSLISFVKVPAGAVLLLDRVIEDSSKKAVVLLDNRLSNMTYKDMIFFKHMRKSGGTTLRHYFYKRLLNVTDAKKNCVREVREGKASYAITETINAVCKTDRWTYYEQEYGSLSVKCADETPWDRVLTITILREPLARQWSEFWNKINGPADNLIKEPREVVQEAFLAWVEREGKPVIRRPRLQPLKEKKNTAVTANRSLSTSTMYPGAYYSNFQTRQIIGNCTEGRSSGVDTRSKQLWCAVGSGKRGGCRFDQSPPHPTQAEIGVAKRILQRFDAVLLTETLRSAGLSLERIMAKVSGISMNETIAAIVDEKVQTISGNPYPAMSSILDKRAIKFLQEDNAADIALYEFARQSLALSD